MRLRRALVGVIGVVVETSATVFKALVVVGKVRNATRRRVRSVVGGGGDGRGGGEGKEGGRGGRGRGRGGGRGEDGVNAGRMKILVAEEINNELLDRLSVSLNMSRLV